MNTIRCVGAVLVCLALTGCLSDGGSNSGGGEARASGGAYQGLAKTESGEANWVVALVNDDQLLLGSLRNADDRVLGEFQVDLGEDEGWWYPVDGVAEAVQIDTASRAADMWSFELSGLDVPLSWSVSLEAIPEQDSAPTGTYRWKGDTGAWEITLNEDESFVVRSATCSFAGGWRQVVETAPAFLSLGQIEPDSGCMQGEVWQAGGLYRDHQIPDSDVIHLIWETEGGASGGFAFADS